MSFETINSMRSHGEDADQGLTMEGLMEALFYRDEFLSIASHELKTPLTSIKLHTQVFRRSVDRKDPEAYSKERVDRLLEQLEKQTSRMSGLIEDMLDISRIRSGKLIMVKEEFNLPLLLKDVVEKHRPEFSQADQVRTEIDEDIWFFGDRSRIEQLITIILKNALKYGLGKPITVKLVQRKNKTVLTISDLGRGIHPDDQKRIFHRFQRAVAASEISGLGLGLYIAREIATIHQGKISVKSALNEGATFKVEFNREEELH